MNFARRATIALVTGILAVSSLAISAGSAEAKRDSSWPTYRVGDSSWPTG